MLPSFFVPHEIAKTLSNAKATMLHSLAEGLNEEWKTITLTFRPETRQALNLDFSVSRLCSSIPAQERSLLFGVFSCYCLGLIDEKRLTQIAVGIMCNGDNFTVINDPPDFPCPDRAMFQEFLKHGQSMGVFAEHGAAIAEAKAIVSETSANHQSMHIPDALRTIMRKLLASGQQWMDAPALQSSATFTSMPDKFDIALGNLDGAPIFYRGEGALVTIAPPGSGKTQCHVLPTIRDYAGSMVVLDIKGECYQKTAHLRQGKVFRYSPFDYKNSAQYNPLEQLSRDPLTIFREARILAGALVRPTVKGDAHWDNRARDLLAAIIGFVILESEEKTMREVMSWVSAPSDEFTQLCETLSESPVTGLRNTGNALKSQLERMPKSLESTLETLRGHLSVWEEDTLLHISEKSSWSPAALRDEPITIYICVPLEAVESYSSAIRVIISQHVDAICPENDNSMALYRPLLMLDELPRLGHMDAVQRAIDVGRGYGLRTWIFAQYMSQLSQAYGREQAEGMVWACGMRAFMNISPDSAKMLSQAIGREKAAFEDKFSLLAETHELSSPEWRDLMLIMSQNEYPMKLEKDPFYKQI